MNDFWIFMASYFAVFIGVIFLLNFLTKGFIWVWLRTLLSRGRLVLVQVRNPIQNYWITGKLESNRVVVRDYESKEANGKKNLMLSEGVVYRCFGVNVVYYDESTGELIKPNLKNVAGADLLKMDSLLTRCLYRPQNEEDVKFRRIVYIALAISIVVGVLIYFKVDELAKLIATPTAVGGVLNGFIGFRIRK